MSFVSDSVGEEFCQQMASRIEEAPGEAGGAGEFGGDEEAGGFGEAPEECRVICSVVPVRPLFFEYMWRMLFSCLISSFSDLKWINM